MKKKDKKRLQIAVALAGIVGAGGLLVYLVARQQNQQARITQYGYPRY